MPTLDKIWKKASADGDLIKFGGGFYCGKLTTDASGAPLKTPIYVFNAFFMSMRAKFVKPGSSLYYFVVEWDATATPWEDFRGKLLGPTDPAKAPADSLRGIINSKWKQLGLKDAPNVTDNGVHASASPFEAMAERLNWMATPLRSDPFARAMLAAGIPEAYLLAGTVDPQVNLGDGKKGSLFDALEDLDTEPCLAKLTELAKLA